MGYYLTACVCLNGHVITGRAQKGFGRPYCSECGEKTVTACSDCKADIQGEYEAEGVFSMHSMSRAKPYCYACGAAYPWTQRKLDAVNELAEAITELTDHERGLINELLPHVVQETPRTEVAGFKIGTVIQRLGAPAKKAISEVLISIAADAGKKAMGLA